MVESVEITNPAIQAECVCIVSRKNFPFFIPSANSFRLHPWSFSATIAGFLEYELAPLDASQKWVDRVSELIEPNF